MTYIFPIRAAYGRAVVIAITLLTGCSGHADCGWNGEARAYIDHNHNQVWDSAEPPLPKVKFFVDDTLNEYRKVNGEDVSNVQGTADLGVFLPGCPRVAFEVYAEPPDGYILTTPARLPVHYGAAAEVFEFGFAPR